MTPKIKVQTFKVFEGNFFSDKLGEIWQKLCLMYFDMEKNAPKMKYSRFFGGNSFGVFFGRVWGNLGKNPSHPQKFDCFFMTVTVLVMVQAVYGTFLKLCHAFV